MNTSFIQGPLDGATVGIKDFPARGDVAICEANDARYEYVYDWCAKELAFFYHSTRKKSLTNKSVALRLAVKLINKGHTNSPGGYIAVEAVT